MKFNHLSDEDLIDYKDLLESVLSFPMWLLERWAVKHRLTQIYAEMARRQLFFAGGDLETPEPDKVFVDDDRFPVSRLFVDAIETIDITKIMRNS